MGRSIGALAEAVGVEAGRSQPQKRRAGQRFFLVHRWQQTRQPGRQHRLAGARRADEQQAVATGRGDLQGALGAGLALHVPQVGTLQRGRARQRLWNWQLLCRVACLKRLHHLHHLHQAARRADRQPCHAGRCLRAGLGQHQRALMRCAAHRQCQRQGAAHGPQLAGQRQLAGELEGLGSRRVPVAGRGEDAQRDRQVEAPRLLGHVGRCQVDRRLLCGKAKPLCASAARTRSRTSFTSVSARPTSVKLGRPLARCTSTVTGCACIPSSARLWITAKDMLRIMPVPAQGARPRHRTAKHLDGARRPRLGRRARETSILVGLFPIPCTGTLSAYRAAEFK